VEQGFRGHVDKVIVVAQMEGGTLTLTNTETIVVATAVVVTFLNRVPTPFPGLTPCPAVQMFFDKNGLEMFGVQDFCSSQ
jgi:hypothetical protein